jgi:hypothetical protein
MPHLTGNEPQSQEMRPRGPEGQRYRSYTAALRHLDPPRLLENRVSFRLLDVAWPRTGGGVLTCVPQPTLMRSTCASSLLTNWPQPAWNRRVAVA